MSSLRSVLRAAGYAALVVLLAACAFWAGTLVNEAVATGPALAHAANGSPVIEHRANQIGDTTVGEVVVNDQVVIRMRTDAGGFTAPERAMIIAERIRDWTAGPFSPYDLALREGAYGAAELRAHGRLIVTVNPQEAEALSSTAMGLARAWHDNMMLAMGVARQDIPEVAATAGAPGEAPGAGAAGEEGAQEAVAADWPPPEEYDDKIVPIVSVLEGVKVGAARVNGPKSKLGQVAACAQLETKFQDFLEIDVYVPITTNKPGPGGLDRVQQVGVTGLGDIEL
ncbi:MAG: hypothetical protein U9R79_16405 [Armatimonadota bacterium]|nr:hypothetical protein [Armatimonadota bacterium]